MIVSEMFTDKKLPIPAVSVDSGGQACRWMARRWCSSRLLWKRRSSILDGVVFLPGLKPGPPVNRESITCFMNSLDKAVDLRASSQRPTRRRLLNFVQLRRDTLGDSYECEAIAAAQPGQGVTGKIVITGTQLAFGSGEEDSRLAFQRLEKALTPVGGKLTDTVWVQFYPLSGKAAESIRKVQFDFFDKKKAPGKQAISIRGVAFYGRAVRLGSGYRIELAIASAILLAVEAAVLDEDLVGVHSGDDHARQIHSLALAFERFGIRVRASASPARSVIPMRVQELEVGTVAGHREHEIILERRLVPRASGLRSSPGGSP